MRTSHGAICVLALLGGSACVACAQVGRYYITDYSRTVVVSGGSVVTSWGHVYNHGPGENNIAVWDDVRTTGYGGDWQGGRYSAVDGTPLGPVYASDELPVSLLDGTTDGSYNYTVSGPTVYRFDRDWNFPTVLFTAGTNYDTITCDPVNHVMWLAQRYGTSVSRFDMSGNHQFTFDTGHTLNYSLAFDPLQPSLWLIDANTNRFEQYSLGGTLLTSFFVPGVTGVGGEFGLIPAPSTLVAAGLFVAAGHRRRR